jgi:hypothetical protein
MSFTGKRRFPGARRRSRSSGFGKASQANAGDCHSFLSLLPVFVPHSQPYSQRLILYFPVATIWVTGGPKVLEFYEAFAKQRATLSRADGKDILLVKVHLSSEREAE